MPKIIAAFPNAPTFLAKTMKLFKILFFALLLASFSIASFAQSQGVLKRTTTKTDRLDFGVGGSISVTGAPVGSIRIEGWKNREVEITAEIEVQANNEADLKMLGDITGFVLQESLGRTDITSIGTHDKKYVKKLGKKLPKGLAAMPFRIDYVIKVPMYSDINVDGGHGDLTISGVEGDFVLNYLDTNAKIDLVGGSMIGVFGKGSVEFAILKSSWRGRMADVSLAIGEMNVRLPGGINAELDASILRTGKIDNVYEGLKPRVRRAEFTDKSIVAKAGLGGIPLKFTVGDGTLKLSLLGG